MFWTDWAPKNPRIMTAWMDGTHIRTVVNRNRRVIWPNGIAVDEIVQRIYWTDGFLHSISYSDFDGRNYDVLFSSDIVMPHPYAIAIYKVSFDIINVSSLSSFSFRSTFGSVCLSARIAKQLLLRLTSLFYDKEYLGLYRKNAIAIESEANDSFGGNAYYVTMQITLTIPEFTPNERNVHCDVLHITPDRVARLFLGDAIAAFQTSR